MHVFNIFQLKPSTYLNQIVALGSKDSMLQLYLFEAKPQQECPTERDFIMQRIVNEIARKAEQSMGFGRGQRRCCDASCDGESRVVWKWALPSEILTLW